MKNEKGKNLKINLKILESLSFLKNKYFWIFLLFFAIGVFLRGYKFEPWLHFELDQARDAVLIDESLEGGVSKLPLLGPRAAGSYLRLGPIFYYIEYGFSFLVGSSVLGSALASLFFSVLAMIVFYFFLRRFFSKDLSLATGSIFATSLFLVTYARFAWNPNLIPFFAIAFSWALLQAVDGENKKRQGAWLMTSAFLFGILAQLHFLALIIVFLAGVIFLVFKRPKIKFVFWAGSVLIVFFLHLPMVINDIKSEGGNIKQLTGTVGEKSESKKDYDLAEKVVKNFSENALSYWTIVTGSQAAELPRIAFDFQSKKIEVDCVGACRQNLHKGLLASVFFALGAIILIWKTIREKNLRKKDFLIFNGIMFVVSFVIFTLLAYDISPRFYLIVIALPFVFWGLIVYEISRVIKIKNLGWAFAIVFAAFNLYFTTEYLRQLAKTASEPISIGTDKILRQKTRITWEQQNAIADYMEEKHQKNGYAILFYGQSEFHRAFSYLLDKKEIPRDGLSVSAGAPICQKVNYFLIIRTQSNKKSLAKYFKKFSLFEEKQFGTLTVYHLNPKKEFINCEAPDVSKFRTYKNEGGAVSKRYIWEEILGEE
ncbi:MAG: glycosyltransferase family 39 protein [Candidatus Moraniibacteriota bacterium]